jgi:hypothetical protein
MTEQVAHQNVNRGDTWEGRLAWDLSKNAQMAHPAIFQPVRDLHEACETGLRLCSDANPRGCSVEAPACIEPGRHRIGRYDSRVTPPAPMNNDPAILQDNDIRILLVRLVRDCRHGPSRDCRAQGQHQGCDNAKPS